MSDTTTYSGLVAVNQAGKPAQDQAPPLFSWLSRAKSAQTTLAARDDEHPPTTEETISRPKGETP